MQVVIYVIVFYTERCLFCAELSCSSGFNDAPFALREENRHPVHATEQVNDFVEQ
jgi:hypothetical protein